jgi:hypothetical protein
VDPIDTGPVGGRFETFDANARFVIVRDDEGYGVWRLDDLEDGEPIERFSDDDRGYEAAASRWKELTAVGRRDVWLGRLKWIVVASGAVWALASIIQAVLIPIEYGMSGGPVPRGRRIPQRPVHLPAGRDHGRLRDDRGRARRVRSVVVGVSA